MAMACRLDDCSNVDCVQLTEREFSVCALICSSDGAVSFGQLKETTTLHQELVSRIVRRLMVHGLVEKTDAGYLGKCGQ
jgi:DNA-binding HxlR family transcriptional regulator